MKSTKIWRFGRKRDTPSYNFRNQPCGISKFILERLSSIGYKKIVGVYKQNILHEIVYWPCKRMGHVKPNFWPLPSRIRLFFEI